MLHVLKLTSFERGKIEAGPSLFFPSHPPSLPMYLLCKHSQLLNMGSP